MKNLKRASAFAVFALLAACAFAKPFERKAAKTSGAAKAAAKPAVVYDEEHVNAAIEKGDCAYLFAYVYSEGADAAVAKKAQATISSYAQITGCRYSADKMEARVRQVPKDIQAAVFENPKEQLPTVVKFLASGSGDKFAQLKVMHDWVCDNIAYDTEMYFSGRWTNQDYESVLKKKKAVCSGYSNLLQKMCELAGIEAIVISGYSKGPGYNGKIGKNPDHAWNAVHIGGKWHLVDATWDAGYLDYKTWIKRYSVEYFCLDSRSFLYTHLPQEDCYQYYAPCLSVEQFENEPKIPGKFFQKGLSLADDKLRYNNLIDGEFSFEINAKNSLSISSHLLQNGNFVENSGWTTRKGNKITAIFDVPDKNEYKAAVYAQDSYPVPFQLSVQEYEGQWLPQAQALLDEKKISEKEFEYLYDSYFKVAENGSYYYLEDLFDTLRNTAAQKVVKLIIGDRIFSSSVFDFKLQADKSYSGYGKGVLRYPYTFFDYVNATNTVLLSPVAGSLKSGTTQHFEVSSSNYTQLALVVDGEWVSIPKAKNGVFELDYEIPDNLQSLVLSGSKDGRNYQWLLQFAVGK